MRREYLVNPLNGALMRPTPAAYKWIAACQIVRRHQYSHSFPSGWNRHRAVIVKPKDKIRHYALLRRGS